MPRAHVFLPFPPKGPDRTLRIPPACTQARPCWQVPSLATLFRSSRPRDPPSAFIAEPDPRAPATLAIAITYNSDSPSPAPFHLFSSYRTSTIPPSSRNEWVREGGLLGR
ncbi:hypothetical protein BKA66DRAFT_145573 [Pyrenochaeta sp. MPI-SDFR-AT-0127]|nr:hypothetical protein BKA66DRAFT_145573 [Pyrenochaeta sp. MPI-SDFR-AT-0127]